MQSLSKKEIEVIANLEFEQRYFFTNQDIGKFFATNHQRIDFIHGLRSKGRIIKINRHKYYLTPIKARSGGWSEHAFIIADEICDGEDYYIGGYAAAKYWKLTDQVPMQTDVYTTRRQGAVTIMNNRLVFHRTTPQKACSGVQLKIEEHPFLIQNKEASQAWLKQHM